MSYRILDYGLIRSPTRPLLLAQSAFAPIERAWADDTVDDLGGLIVWERNWVQKYTIQKWWIMILNHSLDFNKREKYQVAEMRLCFWHKIRTNRIFLKKFSVLLMNEFGAKIKVLVNENFPENLAYISSSQQWLSENYSPWIYRFNSVMILYICRKT